MGQSPHLRLQAFGQMAGWTSGVFSNRGNIFKSLSVYCVGMVLSQIALTLSLPPLFCESDFHSIHGITAMDLLNSSYEATHIVCSNHGATRDVCSSYS